ncbi:hypothetical protein VTK73DRAFT_4347 [Phialemonium thermophilum]|uniref:Uncharacterized protein n=1 Tax=Phialemonium thermophilum TaxID=223376 RepID=A0ABR3V9G1_9PEZI
MRTTCAKGFVCSDDKRRQAFRQLYNHATASPELARSTSPTPERIRHASFDAGGTRSPTSFFARSRRIFRSTERERAKGKGKNVPDSWGSRPQKQPRP